MTPKEKQEYAQKTLKTMFAKAMMVNSGNGGLTTEQTEVISKLSDNLAKAMDVNAFANNNFAKIEDVLRFLLDRFNTGSFYGTIEIKIEGAIVKDPKITNQTVRLDRMY